MLHAPLEPSPTGAHDTIRSSNAGRSADLGVLNSESATPSVWNGARRRVMQVLNLLFHNHACTRSILTSAALQVHAESLYLVGSFRIRL